MYCTNCGSENSSGDKFCRKCGKHLTEDVGINPSPGLSNAPDVKVNTNFPQSADCVSLFKNKVYLASLAAGIGGAVLCIMGCFLPLGVIGVGFFAESIRYIDVGGGIILLIMSISIILGLLKFQKINIVISCFTLIKLSINIYGIPGEDIVEFGAGFFCMIFGAIALFISSVIAFKGNWDDTKNTDLIVIALIAALSLIIVFAAS